ncbi:MAG TPA: DoxX family protein [Acidimicrobiales bacterium]|nr:DoxX family protein [Acidimicrobiales bacterium]
MSRLRRRAPKVLAAMFSGSGIIHLVRPQTFDMGMPRVIPQKHHTNLIYLSGVAEILCAIGLLKRTRWGGPASAALLVGVFPVHIQMAMDAGTGRNPGIADKPAAAWARMPLQIPMIWAALQAKPED